VPHIALYLHFESCECTSISILIPYMGYLTTLYKMPFISDERWFCNNGKVTAI
jgi:hypothetical protein